MKSSLCSIFVLLAAFAQSQILNPGFEEGTQSTVDNWTKINGSAGVFSKYTISRKEGDTVIKANQGTSFLALNQKNLKTKATISSVFQLDSRKSRLTGKFIYLPGDYTQRFDITAVYTIFENGKRDTIMQQSTLFTTISQDGDREYDWRTLDINFKKESFLRDGNPDTCFISITANTTSSNNESTLLVDDLKFSSDLMAGTLSTAIPNLKLYPTIVSNALNIESSEPIQSISVFDLAGHLMFSKISRNQFSERIDTESLLPGTYIILIFSNQRVKSQQFYKSF